MILMPWTSASSLPMQSPRSLFFSRSLSGCGTPSRVLWTGWSPSSCWGRFLTRWWWGRRFWLPCMAQVLAVSRCKQWCYNASSGILFCLWCTSIALQGSSSWSNSRTRQAPSQALKSTLMSSRWTGQESRCSQKQRLEMMENCMSRCAGLCLCALLLLACSPAHKCILADPWESWRRAPKLWRHGLVIWLEQRFTVCILQGIRLPVTRTSTTMRSSTAWCSWLPGRAPLVASPTSRPRMCTRCNLPGLLRQEPPISMKKASRK